MQHRMGVSLQKRAATQIRLVLLCSTLGSSLPDLNLTFFLQKKAGNLDVDVKSLNF